MTKKEYCDFCDREMTDHDADYIDGHLYGSDYCRACCLKIDAYIKIIRNNNDVKAFLENYRVKPTLPRETVRRG